MKRVFPHLLLLIFSLLVLIPVTPSHQEEILRDSGVFLYIGDQILDGKIPYRDLWDHKGPVIYYIDALALLLGGGSRWGIWFFELISLSAAALFGYLTLNAALGVVPAIFGTLMWLAGFHFVSNGGNLTEEYTLPFQFSAILLFWRSRHTSQPQFWSFLLIGLTTGISFFLRPNNTGIQLSILILITLYALRNREWKAWILNCLGVLLGALFVGVGVGVYFVFKDLFPELFAALISFNFAYTTAPWLARLGSLREGYEKYLAVSGFQFLILPTWILGLIYALRDKNGLTPRKSLLHLALIGFPLEIVLSSLSGEAYEHYYILWLPVVGILASYFAYGALIFSSSPTTPQISTLKPCNLPIYALMIGILIVPILKIIASLNPYPKPYYLANTQKILKYLDGEEYLLMWGAESEYNFLMDTPSPTRFFYQYPLYECDYDRNAFVIEFDREIRSKKPLIIDTSSNNDKIPPLNAAKRRDWITQGEGCLHPNMDPLFSWIEANYQIVAILQPYWGKPYLWTIYKALPSN